VSAETEGRLNRENAWPRKTQTLNISPVGQRLVNKTNIMYREKRKFHPTRTSGMRTYTYVHICDAHFSSQNIRLMPCIYCTHTKPPPSHSPVYTPDHRGMIYGSRPQVKVEHSFKTHRWYCGRRPSSSRVYYLQYFFLALLLLSRNHVYVSKSRLC